MDDIPDIISWRKDRDSRYLSCNQNYAQALNIEPQDILGKTDFDFYPTSLAEKYRADNARVMEKILPLRMEEKFSVENDGRCVFTIKMPIIDECLSNATKLFISRCFTRPPVFQQSLDLRQ